MVAKYREPDMVFDVFDFMIPSSRIVSSSEGSMYDTASFEIDSDKFHDECQLPIINAIETIVEEGSEYSKKPKWAMTFCEPTDMWLKKHPNYHGFVLAFYELGYHVPHFIAEFKFTKANKRLAGMDIERDIDEFMTTTIALLYGHPRISKYLPGGKRFPSYSNFDDLKEYHHKLGKFIHNCEKRGMNIRVINPGSWLDPLFNINEPCGFNINLELELPDVRKEPSKFWFDIRKKDNCTRIKSQSCLISTKDKYCTMSKYACYDRSFLMIAHENYMKILEVLLEYSEEIAQ